ncbi:hypothetical protein [Salmonirosea aquatica]|uniref:SCO family protein n=1 Tax=Salmonirosea aquatica TaxID=2654236 RepID=A0A7C9BHE2_9BACT|nr:hypothetical protein [Cytophagaceae bacterium SJW1-29]
MQKYIKTGLLIIVLVVPVLIFLFLQGYTTNHFDLPYYVPLRDPVTNEVIRENGDTVFYQIKDFSLPVSDGYSTTNRVSIKGKITVVSAFKAPCEKGCERALSQLKRIQALHQSYPSLNILTILDEEENTLVEKIGDRPKSGWLLAKVPDSVYHAVLQNVFYLIPKDEKQTKTDFSQFSLVDRDGFIRGFYDARETAEIERLMAEIRVLEYNEKNNE